MTTSATLSVTAICLQHQRDDLARLEQQIALFTKAAESLRQQIALDEAKLANEQKKTEEQGKE